MVVESKAKKSLSIPAKSFGFSVYSGWTRPIRYVPKSAYPSIPVLVGPGKRGMVHVPACPQMVPLVPVGRKTVSYSPKCRTGVKP